MKVLWRQQILDFKNSTYNILITRATQCGNVLTKL